MTPMKVHRNAIIDRMLLTHVLGRAPEGMNRTKLQKVMFRACLGLRDQGLPTPALAFIRWNYGPFSQPVYQHVAAIGATGIAEQVDDPRAGRITRLTDGGRATAGWLTRALERTPGWIDVRDVLDEAVAFGVARSAETLSAWSHDLVLRPDGMDFDVRVHDMTDGDPILDPEVRLDWLPLPVDDDLIADFVYAASLTPAHLAEMTTPSALSIDELLAL